MRSGVRASASPNPPGFCAFRLLRSFLGRSRGEARNYTSEGSCVLTPVRSEARAPDFRPLPVAPERSSARTLVDIAGCLRHLAGDEADGSQSRGLMLMLSEWPLRSPHWRQRSCALRSASRVKLGRLRVRHPWSMAPRRPQRRQTASTRCHILRSSSRKA